MSFNRDKEFMRQIILTHYESPQNKIDEFKKMNGYESYNNNSPSCIDNLTVFVKLKQNKIVDAKFSGIGCAIATSSTDIVLDMVKNKTTKVANKIIDNYLNMIDSKKYDQKLLGDLYVFENINQQINRISCAKVGITALKKAINK